ncbi:MULTISPECIES: pyridoxamine 5'-phosphate oxidase family protein [Salinibaculum]|uniref:pyridoxamine 5'-phosphate oxidase family protein n=1 Tax=Salinibaculum TaxID=2732368 RepID=UPI0030CBFA87
MTRDTWREMSDEAIAEFLSSRGHGVLSLGGDRPYALPMSFGYDGPNRRCVMQFMSGPDSRKRDRVDPGTPACLVVYEWHHEDDWRSVIAEGQLDPIPAGSERERAAGDRFGEDAATVGLSIFGHPVADLDPQWYDLEIETLSGYRSPLDP